MTEAPIADEIAAEITRLKAALGGDVCVMGHHYQQDSVAAHCDVMGDSLELARKIGDVKARHIVFCGVYFMGETAALLAGRGQRVYLPEPDADCMMSLMASARLAESVLEELAANGRRIIPLAYVNTMLELKEVVGRWGGAVCTSANAGKMLRWALGQGDGVLFLPDKNLGRNTAAALGIPPSDQYILRLTGKGLAPGQEERLGARLLFWPGGCAVHAKMAPRLVEEARRRNPGCRVLVHPECKPDVVAISDGSGSTSYLIREAGRLARESPGVEVIIGTEENLVGRLAETHRQTLRLRPLGPAICPHMEKVSPEKLLAVLRGIVSGDAAPVEIDPQKADNARMAITTMLDVCGR